MPREFNKPGITFQYPDNWTLDEEVARTDCEAVTVYSPGGGFWAISVHPRSVDPAELIEAAVEAIREEYKELETDEVQEAISGHELIGRDLSFYYLDLVNTASVRSVRTDQATYTIFCQAEDHEFRRIHEVFLAMTTSLLGNVKRLGRRD